MTDNALVSANPRIRKVCIFLTGVLLVVVPFLAAFLSESCRFLLNPWFLVDALCGGGLTAIQRWASVAAGHDVVMKGPPISQYIVAWIAVGSLLAGLCVICDLLNAALNRKEKVE